MSVFSIGETARRTGVKVPTIRYYEDIGLLPKQPRLDNNRRTFDQAAVDRLSFIKHARGMGFEIDDIGTLLSLRDHPNQSCREADQIARARLNDIECRIRELQSLRKELKAMVESCHQTHVDSCHIIEGLSERPCAACA